MIVSLKKIDMPRASHVKFIPNAIWSRVDESEVEAIAQLNFEQKGHLKGIKNDYFERQRRQ